MVCFQYSKCILILFLQVDRHESARATKKAELIENLKRLFPGVVSTVALCFLNSRFFIFLKGLILLTKGLIFCTIKSFNESINIKALFCPKRELVNGVKIRKMAIFILTVH